MQLLYVFIFVSFMLWSLSNAKSAPLSKTIHVKASGGGDYTTIGDAIKNGVPENNKGWIRIIVHAGTYREQVVVPANKPYILLNGESKESTFVDYNGSGLQDATIIVLASNFVAGGITFKNSYNLLMPNKHTRMQAVAASLRGDKVSFRNCSFLSVQDTLSDVEGRHFFHQCYIEGYVDFICGNGQSVYQRCTINVTAPGGIGYITAQKRSSKSDPTGFVFKNCKVRGTGLVYLGRAWGPFSRVIFYKTHFENIIQPEGWQKWIGDEEDYVYAEVDCSGPGANNTMRVKWEKKLTDKQVNYFTGKSFIDKDSWVESQPKPVFIY